MGMHTDALINLTMATPESPAINAIYSVMGLATRQAADLVGCSADWLNAWWLEHRFGERPMMAGLPGQPLREIKTIEELAALILDDAALAGGGEAVKERPILFSAPMVRALLSGEDAEADAGESSSRREACVLLGAAIRPASESGYADPGVGTLDARSGRRDGQQPPQPVPYGQPGDRLWVREAFMHEPADYCWSKRQHSVSAGLYGPQSRLPGVQARKEAGSRAFICRATCRASCWR